MSFVDATLKTMRIAEFLDNDMLSNLEAIMVQVRGLHSSERNFRLSRVDGVLLFIVTSDCIDVTLNCGPWLPQLFQIGASECLISSEVNNPDVNKAKALLERYVRP